jgi:hypothetical protein
MAKPTTTGNYAYIAAVGNIAAFDGSYAFCPLTPFFKG